MSEGQNVKDNVVSDNKRRETHTLITFQMYQTMKSFNFIMFYRKKNSARITIFFE